MRSLLKRIDHMELVVRDPEQFIAFFEKMGFKVLTRSDHHHGSAEMALPGPDQIIFEIHGVEGEENPGMNHIAFLTDNVKEDFEKLKKKGIAFESDCHLVKATGRMIANFRDPDGFRLQLTDEKRAEPVAGEFSTTVASTRRK